jgi:hypothetical protein
MPVFVNVFCRREMATVKLIYPFPSKGEGTAAGLKQAASVISAAKPKGGE